MYRVQPRLSAGTHAELLDHSADVVTILDEDGVIQYESPSITRVLGYEPSERLGDVICGHLRLEDRDAVQVFGLDLLEGMTSNDVSALIESMAPKYGEMTVIKASIELQEHTEQSRGVR